MPSSHQQSQEDLVAQAQILISRLERMSADSIWARRASGVRGALLGIVEKAQSREALSLQEQRRLEELLDWGFRMLVKAAQELIA